MWNILPLIGSGRLENVKMKTRCREWESTFWVCDSGVVSVGVMVMCFKQPRHSTVNLIFMWCILFLRVQLIEHTLCHEGLLKLTMDRKVVGGSLEEDLGCNTLNK